MVVGLFFSSLLQAPKYSTLTDFQLQHVLSSCIVSCAQDDAAITIRVPSFCEGIMSAEEWLLAADKKTPNLMVVRSLNPSMLTPHTYELARAHAQNTVSIKGDSCLTQESFWVTNSIFKLRCDELDVYVLRFAHDEEAKECVDRPVLGWYRLDPQNFSEESYFDIRRRAVAPFIMHKYPFSRLTTEEFNSVEAFAQLVKFEKDILIRRAIWEEGVVPLYLWNNFPSHAQYAWFRLNPSKIDRDTFVKVATKIESLHQKGAEFIKHRRIAHTQRQMSPVSLRGRLDAAMKYVATTQSVVDAFSAGRQRPQMLASLAILKKP